MVRSFSPRYKPYIMAARPGSQSQRDSARDELKSSQGFRTLNNLRNALAHGVRPSDQGIERTLKDETNLRNTLKSLLTQLLGLERKQGA